MIDEAEEDGHAHARASTILEPSSGNTGIALAMICQAARATRSRSCCRRTSRSSGASCSRSSGAEIILIARRRGLQRRRAPGPGAGRGAPRVVRSRTSTATTPTPGPTTRRTGPEIWRDCPEITHFVAGLGTAGTLMGVGTYLKEQQPRRQGLGRRAARGRDGRGPEQPRRGLHPAGVTRSGAARAARRQAHRAAPRVDRVDPPPHRGRRVRRHLVGRRAGRRGEGRRRRSTRA